MHQELSSFYINRSRINTRITRQYSVHNETSDYPIKEDSLYEILTQKYPPKNSRNRKSKHHKKHQRGHKKRETDPRMHRNSTMDAVLPILYSSSLKVNEKDKQPLGIVDCILNFLRENELVQTVIPFFEPSKCKCKDAEEQTEQALIVEGMPPLSPELFIRENVCNDPEYPSTATESEYLTSHNKIERSTSVSLDIEVTKQDLHTQTDKLNLVQQFSSPMKRGTSSEISRIFTSLLPLYKEHQKRKAKLSKEMKKRVIKKDSKRNWCETIPSFQESFTESQSSVSIQNISMCGQVSLSKTNSLPLNSSLNQQSHDQDNKESCNCKTAEIIKPQDEIEVSNQMMPQDTFSMEVNVEEEVKNNTAWCHCKSSIGKDYSCNNEAICEKYLCGKVRSEELSNGKYSYDREISKETLRSTQERLNIGPRKKPAPRKQTVDFDQKFMYKTTQCSRKSLPRSIWTQFKERLKLLEQITYRDFDNCQCFNHNNFMPIKPYQHICRKTIKKKANDLFRGKQEQAVAMRACWYEFNHVCYQIWCEFFCFVSVVLTIVLIIFYYHYVR